MPTATPVPAPTAAPTAATVHKKRGDDKARAELGLALGLGLGLGLGVLGLALWFYQTKKFFWQQGEPDAEKLYDEESGEKKQLQLQGDGEEPPVDEESKSPVFGDESKTGPSELVVADAVDLEFEAGGEATDAAADGGNGAFLNCCAAEL